jgi:hypothetical protein
VAALTSDRCSPHQTTLHHLTRVQAPAQKGVTRLAKGVSGTAPLFSLHTLFIALSKGTDEARGNCRT